MQKAARHARSSALNLPMGRPCSVTILSTQEAIFQGDKSITGLPKVIAMDSQVDLCWWDKDAVQWWSL